MVSINEDIAEHIVNSHDSWTQQDLYHLVFISSAWIQAARRCLYAFPKLHTYKSCQNLLRSLEENPALLPLVRALDLRPSDETISSRKDLKEHMALAEYFPGPTRLLQITRLERLVLGGDLATNAERFLHIVAFPHTVRALHIISPTLCEGRIVRQGSLAWDISIPMRFHSLESLSLDGPLVLDINDLHYDDSKRHIDTGYVRPFYRGCMLKELHLRGVENSERFGSIGALLVSPAAWRHLRALTFSLENHSAFDHTSLASILEISSGSLEHLIYRSCGGDGDWMSPFLHYPVYAGTRPPLLRLKTLETSFVAFYHSNFRSVMCNVERLVVVGAYEEFAYDMVRYVESNEFPRLQRLFLSLDKSDQCTSIAKLHNGLNVLAARCRDRGIVFTVILKTFGLPGRISPFILETTLYGLVLI